MAKKDDCKAIKDGIKEIFSVDLTQQQLEKGYAWVWDAIRQGTKEAIEKAIEEGKIKR